MLQLSWELCSSPEPVQGFVTDGFTLLVASSLQLRCLHDEQAPSVARHPPRSSAPYRCLVSGGTCRKKVDMAAYVPADSLVYLELNSPH